MILENKDIEDATVLRLISKVLKKNPTAKGFKLNTRRGVRTLTYDELTQFIDELAQRLKDGDYGVIRRCNTCGNFSRSGKSTKIGWCFPKEHTLTRNAYDHCCKWTPMSAEQQKLKERLDEHFGTLQTKRVGDGSEDSNQGN